nr:reverse transcriptase domain-containing protein [Tanacetum cinerariifolium]
PKVLAALLSNHEEGERVGRDGGRGRGPRGGNDDHVDELNGQRNDQGVRANGGAEGVNGNVEGVNGGAPDFSTIIAQQLLNLLPAMLAQEVVVSMSRNDFKFIMIEEFCPSHDMQKLETELWNHAMVGAGHATYTDRFHELARLVPHLVTLESRKIKRNGSIKKVEKKGNVGEPSKDKNDNKRLEILLPQTL